MEPKLKNVVIEYDSGEICALGQVDQYGRKVGWWNVWDETGREVARWFSPDGKTRYRIIDGGKI